MNTHALAYIAAGLAVLALAAGQPVQEASAADPNKRIETEQEYREKVVGKKLVQENGYVMSHEDGTVSGEFGDQSLSGTWTWEDKYFCRTVTLGTRDFGRDCQVVEVSGDSLTVIRNKGEGKRSPVYRIEPGT